MKAIASAALLSLAACVGSGIHGALTCRVQADGQLVDGKLSPDGKVCSATVQFLTEQPVHIVKLKPPAADGG